MTKQHSKTKLTGKKGQHGKSRKPANKNTPHALFNPLNHNPLIACEHLDTLANVNAVIEFLQSCDLQRQGNSHLLQKRSADGLYLLHKTVSQALQFEISARQTAR